MGTPSRRGQRSSDHPDELDAHRTRLGRPGSASGVPNPSSASPARSHRVDAPSASGGSVTTSAPPAPEEPDRALGGDRGRARTTGRRRDRSCARSRSSRASTSARPHSTATRAPRSRVATARARNSHRRRWASRRTPVASRPHVEQHEAGEAAAAAEIEHPAVELADRAGQVERVLVLARDRTGTEQPQLARFFEDVEQRPRDHGRSSRPSGSRASGRSGRAQDHASARVLALRHRA